MSHRDGPVLAHTIADAVRVSGIGRSKIYDLIRSGHIRAMKAGGRTLVCAESLRRYLADLPRLGGVQ